MSTREILATFANEAPEELVISASEVISELLDNWFCIKLAEDADKINDGTRLTMDEVLDRYGMTYDNLR